MQFEALVHSVFFFFFPLYTTVLFNSKLPSIYSFVSTEKILYIFASIRFIKNNFCFVDITGRNSKQFLIMNISEKDTLL